MTHIAQCCSALGGSLVQYLQHIIWPRVKGEEMKRLTARFGLAAITFM